MSFSQREKERRQLADQFAFADAEIDGLRTNAYNKALLIKDEFFHFALYDWYLSRSMADQLLEVSSRYRHLLHPAELTPLRTNADPHPLPQVVPLPRTYHPREERPSVAVLRPHFSLRRRRQYPRLARRDSRVRSLPS